MGGDINPPIPLFRVHNPGKGNSRGRFSGSFSGSGYIPALIRLSGPGLRHSPAGS